MIHLQLDPAFSSPETERLLREAAKAALEQQSQPKASLTIALTGDAQLQTLNRTHLGIDAPTDVLSFPSDEGGPGGRRGYLGDIVISQPRAAAQAQAGGHRVEEELQLLVVHAVLHLLGYDHAEGEEKTRMWERQAAILHALGNEAAPVE